MSVAATRHPLRPNFSRHARTHAHVLPLRPLARSLLLRRTRDNCWRNWGTRRREERDSETKRALHFHFTFVPCHSCLSGQLANQKVNKSCENKTFHWRSDMWVGMISQIHTVEVFVVKLLSTNSKSRTYRAILWECGKRVKGKGCSQISTWRRRAQEALSPRLPRLTNGRT